MSKSTYGDKLLAQCSIYSKHLRETDIDYTLDINATSSGLFSRIPSGNSSGRYKVHSRTARATPSGLKINYLVIIRVNNYFHKPNIAYSSNLNLDRYKSNKGIKTTTMQPNIAADHYNMDCSTESSTKGTSVAITLTSSSNGKKII